MRCLTHCVQKTRTIACSRAPETVITSEPPASWGTGSTLGLVRQKLSTARSVTVLTGAGISADSRVPTFRGADGFWRHYRAEDLATPEAFARDPRLVWEWYNWRRELIATKRPNPHTDAVAEMERRFKQFWLITQNVDGLHRDAGLNNSSEIHGNIWMVRCTQCRDITENRDVPIAILPLCRSCGGLLRPHIVWFGNHLQRMIWKEVPPLCTAVISV